MATLSTQFPTLLDVIRKQDPDGTPARVIEVLSKVNPILDDIPMVAGNLDTGHRLTIRTALPSLTWRKLNQGVPFTKSHTDQYVETCGMLEVQNAVDDDIDDITANKAAYRMDEDNAAIANMNIEMVNALFYYSTAQTPERLQGFTPRFNQIAGGPVSAGQIIPADASAAGANQTSIWLVGWGPRSAHGIYPKNSAGGIVKRDLGMHLVPDASGANFFASWITKIKWSMGLVVADYRYVVRVCNIDTTRWRNDISQGADLPDCMSNARALLWEENTVQARFYMNRATYGMLNRQLAKKGTVNLLEFIDSGRGRIPTFYGIPIRVTDGILSTESVVA
jgi:hypothetical protein